MKIPGLLSRTVTGQIAEIVAKFATKAELDGKASSSHTHGNITNDGKVGSAANKPIITGTDGVLQAGAFGTADGTFCEGNDSRLSNARPASGGTAEYAEKLGSSGGSYTFGNISTQFGNINTSLANLSTAVGNKVADVKIGNTSLLDSNKVASIPFADNSTDGILGHEEYEIFSETAETVSLNADNWSGKQDAISDLATIRSNASAGAAKVSCTDAAVGGYGYTKNAGTVTQVKVGSTPFNPTSGVVSLPAYYTTSEMDAALAAKAPSSHAHTKSQITDFDHNHDGRYYTESEINTKLSGKQNTLSEGECIIIDGDFINVDTEIVALKEELPTKTSDLTNDSGFLTSHQDISGKVNEPSSEGTSGQVLTTDGNGGRTWTTVQGGGTITDVQVNGSTIVSGGVANIPLANSTTDGVISKAFWSNLSGMYEDYNENGFQAQLVSGTNIKTINNQSLLGSGNIQIQGAYADVNVTVFFNTPSSTTQVTVDTSTSKLGRHNFYATVNGYDINISSGIYNNTLYLWYDEADPTTHGTLSRKWVRCEIGSGYITFLGSGTLTK